MLDTPLYGKRIREIRRGLKLTQEQFSQKTGISLSSLRRYEANERQPTMAALKKMADTLNIEIVDFFESNLVPRRSPFWAADLESKMKQVGCSLGFYEEDAMIWINFPDGALEVMETDLQRLHDDTDSFMKFKLQELKEKYAGQFRPKK